MFILKSLSHGKPESLFRLNQSRWNPLDLVSESLLQLRSDLRLEDSGRQGIFHRVTQRKRALRRVDRSRQPEIIVCVINAKWRIDDRQNDLQLQARGSARMEIR